MKELGAHFQQKEPGHASRVASGGGLRDVGNQRAVLKIEPDQQRSGGNRELLYGLVQGVHTWGGSDQCEISET